LKIKYFYFDSGYKKCLIIYLKIKCGMFGKSVDRLIAFLDILKERAFARL